MDNNFKEVWDNCLQQIKGKVCEQTFKTWFVPIVAKQLKAHILTIQVPSQFFYEWLEEHHLSLLKEVVTNKLGPEGKLEYSIIIDKGNRKKKPFTINLPTYPGHAHKSSYQPGWSLHNEKNGKAVQQFNTPRQVTHLNPNYLFDNFVEGGCNQLAKSAAQSVAKKPGGTSFNPLMLYGGVGLGKTHIAQAIGNEVNALLPGKNVAYISSEKFTTQFIEALRNNNIQSFTDMYLQMDVLILDDIQFLAGKEKTQECFFHIFNHLHQTKKQIVITSDSPPRDLKGLQERLLSRFKWGLTADLQQPDFETRIAIIHNKIAADGINIGNDLIEYVAHSVDTNIRELEGVLISLIAHASLNKKDINLELTQQVLKNIIQKAPVATSAEATVGMLQQEIAKYYGVSLENLSSKSRKKEIVIARQVAMYLAKQYTNHSLKSIGSYFGGRDHSTVIHAIKAVNNMLATDTKFQQNYSELQKKIKCKTT